jgi:hypothetical protein
MQVISTFAQEGFHFQIDECDRKLLCLPDCVQCIRAFENQVTLAKMKWLPITTKKEADL